MDWKFVITQLITALSIIVATAVAAIIVERYKKFGSLGVSQSAQDKLIAASLAIGMVLMVCLPLYVLISNSFRLYKFITESPKAQVSREEAALVAFWILYIHIAAFQVFYALYTIWKHRSKGMSKA